MIRRRPLPSLSNPGSTAIVLAMILLTALTLRFYHLDWDEGTFLHPDELHVVNTITLKIVIEWPPDIDNLFDPSVSRLNPRAIDPDTGRHYNFAYGALPLLVTDLTASTLTKLTGADWNAFYGHIHKVGRALTALLDTGTVALIFLIARSLFGSSAGLAASALYATAPIAIQLSHFFTTDIWMTFFTTLSLWLCVVATRREDGRWFFLAGAAFGLAMASKASVYMLGMAILAAGLCVLRDRRFEGEDAASLFLGLVEQMLLALLGAFFAFALFEPYALLQPVVYLRQIEEQSRIVRGTLDVPFTRQYVDTTPLLYQAEQLFRWGLGPMTALLVLGGLVILLRSAVADQHPGAIVLTVWLITQGALIIAPETKFMRYLEPLMPAAMVGAGGFLVWTIRALYQRYGRIVPKVAVAGVLVGVAFWTTAFMSVYAAPNTRIQASQWIYQHVPAGSTVTAETWDIALPLSLAPGLNATDRQIRQINLDILRDRDPDTVATDIFDTISEADFIVLSSNRVSTATAQSPWRYPVQNRYYDLLANGKLGFDLVATFQQEPGIGSLRFDDSAADESFINYDHPKVLVFQKSTTIDRATYDQLMAPATSQPYQPVRHANTDTLMLDQPVEDQPVVADARWSSRLTSHTLPAVIVWVLLLALLQAVGKPIAAKLFPRFPDAGAGFARLIATLLAAYPVWLLAGLEFASFRVIWCWAAVLLVALLALRLRSKPLPVNSDCRASILGAELTFWSVFALFLLFRFINPDSWHPLWGGEKPMEFAHLNAILRSAHFPPIDPWFSGGYINYYYYGTYLVAFWLKLTGIPSEIAFNLAQPTVIALISSGAYSLASAISRGVAGRRQPWIGGAIGAVLTVIVGNLSSAILLLRGLPDEISPNFIGWTWAGSRAIAGGITEFPYFTGLYADLHAHVIAWPITILAIALCFSLSQRERVFTSAISQGRARLESRLAIAGTLGMLALVLGSLFATNAWDVPVYAALVVISIMMSTRGLPSWTLRIAVTIVGTVATAVAAFVLLLPFITHYVTLFGSLEQTRTVTDVTEFATHLGIFLGIILCGLLMLSFRHGVIHPTLGWLDPIAIIVLYAGLLVLAYAGIGSLATVTAILVIATLALLALAGINLILFTRPWLPLAPTVATGLILLAGMTALALRDDKTLALGLGIALTGALFWLSDTANSERFLGALLAAGGSIIAGVELVFLADDLAGDPVWYRMNTVFKFYNQVWTLLALAAAVLLTAMIRQLLDETILSPTPGFESLVVPESDLLDLPETETPAPSPPPPSRPRLGSQWAQVGVAASAILIAAGLVYPIFSAIPRLDLRFPDHPGIGTLNSLDWMNYGTLNRPDGSGLITFDGDLAAINWFNTEVDGTPVIAEASIGPYRGNGSRISIATGLPAVLGWDRHERQQRYPEGIDTRWTAVRLLYDSPDPAIKMQVIRGYDIQYIVVGDVERYSVIGNRLYASEAGIAAFDTMVGSDLEIAFQSGNTTVYRVIG